MVAHGCFSCLRGNVYALFFLRNGLSRGEACLAPTEEQISLVRNLLLTNTNGKR